MLNWFKKLGIRNKLLLTYASIVLIGAVALVMNIQGTSKLGAAVQTSTDQVTVETALVHELREFQTAMSKADAAGKDHLLTGDPSYLDIRDEFERAAKHHLEEALEFADVHVLANIQAMMLEIESDDAEHAVALEQGHSEALEEEAQHGDEPTGEALAQGHSENLEDGIESLVHHAEESMAETLERALEIADSQTRNVLLTSIVGLVAGVGLAGAAGSFMASSITNPIRKLRELADKISMGDLNVENTVTAKDEIGDLSESFNRMVVAVKFLSSEEQQGSEA